MTSFTPVYDLPYPDALDAPCDFPQDWCEFTTAADVVLDRFELGAQRVLPTVPVAFVAVTETSTAASDIGIPFDTVFADTAGWTDFDSTTQILTITRSGRYTIRGSATAGTQGSLNSTMSLSVRAPGTVATMTTLDRSAQNIGIDVNTEALTLAAGTQVSLVLQWSTSPTPATVPLFSAALSVYWHADEERAS